MIHMVHDTYDAYDRSAEKCIICRGKQGTTKQHMIHMVHETYDTHDRYAESILFVERGTTKQHNLVLSVTCRKLYYLHRKTRDNKATRSGTNRFMIDMQKSILFA